MNAASPAVTDASNGTWEYVRASSTGFVEDRALVNLNYIEKAAGGPQLALDLLPKSDQITLLEMNSLA